MQRVTALVVSASRIAAAFLIAGAGAYLYFGTKRSDAG